MGNNVSSTQKTARNPFEILGVDKTATKDEIRRKYKQLVVKYHPDYNKDANSETLMEINAAYEKILANLDNPNRITEKQPVDVPFDKINDKYLQKLPKDEFFARINALVKLIIENEQIFDPKAKFPLFGTRNTESPAAFYDFYKNFKTKIDFKYQMLYNDKYVIKKENARLRAEYNQNIRNIVKLISKYDPRLKKTIGPVYIPIEIKKPAKKKVRKIKTSEDYQFFCEPCEKGYNSENTLLNHLKSEKHKVMCREKGFVDSIEEVKLSFEAANFSLKKSDEVSIELDQYSLQADQENFDSTIHTANSENVSSCIFKAAEIKINDSDNSSSNSFYNKEPPTDSCKGSYVDFQPTLKKKTASEIASQLGSMRISNKKHAGKSHNTKDKKPVKASKQRRAKKHVGTYNESAQFLKCNHCGSLFESRNKLFVHLRDETCQNQK